MLALCLREQAWTLLLAARKFGSCGFEGRQAFFPLALEPTRDQAVIGIDGTVPTFGATRFIARTFDAEAPLLEHRFPVGFEPLGGGDAGCELCRLEGGDEGPHHGLVDLESTDIEAVDTAAVDKDLAGTMIAR